MIKNREYYWLTVPDKWDIANLKVSEETQFIFPEGREEYSSHTETEIKDRLAELKKTHFIFDFEYGNVEEQSKAQNLAIKTCSELKKQIIKMLKHPLS